MSIFVFGAFSKNSLLRKNRWNIEIIQVFLPPHQVRLYKGTKTIDFEENGSWGELKYLKKILTQKQKRYQLKIFTKH